MKNLNIQLFAANPNAVIPGTDGRNGRSVDKIWQQSDRLSRAIQGALGLEFGSVLTIQEAGVKEENKLYLDSLDGKLYRCKKRTESLANTTEFFELFSVKTNSDRLDNLGTVEEVSWENWKVNIGDLKIRFQEVGVYGTNMPSESVYEFPDMTRIYGYSTISSHVGVYMPYKAYVDGNKIHIVALGETSGHATRILVIGI